MTEAKPGILAGIGAVGDLMLIARTATSRFAAHSLFDPEDDRPPAPLTARPSAYTWPTWSSNGGVLFVSTVEAATAGEPAAQLLRYDLKAESLQIIYQNPAGTAPMGPGLPHYVNPSPDGRHVLVLTQAPPAGLALIFVDASGRGPGRPMSRGAPLFSAWAPSSDSVLLHIGGELSMMDLDTAPATEVFATNHVGYRVPAWSPDGRHFAVSAPNGRNHSLTLYDRDGHITGALATAWDNTAFAWSPDGEVLAQAQNPRSQPQRYTDIQLVGTAKTGVRPVKVQECAAFVWSPTSEHLALLVPDASGQRFGWTVVDRDGLVVRRFPALQPSPEFAVYAAFFDQYLLSHALWSPDGASLLGFGRMPYDGTPPELMPSCVYMFEIASGRVHSIAIGSAAFWSPRSG